ncbi:hypothetical protein HDZ31DRAFT_84753 [Schizophyllum fasciatum]
MKQSGHGVGLASGSGSRPARDDPSTVAGKLLAREKTAIKRKRLTKAQMRWNREFTIKTCTYTDGQGRSVPAPLGTSDQSPSPSHRDSSGMYKSSAALQPFSDDLTIDGYSPRKRSRTSASEATLGYPRVLPTPQISSSFAKLDNALIRELIGLFFAHCESARLIFHKPMFTAALTHGVALSLMFDGAGRLTCEPSLAIAQALCLLHVHETRLGDMTASSMRYHDLIIQVCDHLGVHSSEDTLRPVLGPTSAHIEAAINKECLRRVHWLVYLLDIFVSVYARGSRQWLMADPHPRLPCDEATFEMAVGTTSAEYLSLSSSQAPDVSEMGHFIRVAKIWAQLEFALEDMNSKSHVRDLEICLKAWEASLPSHLHFGDEMLIIKRSMLATSSSNDVWCWANVHMYRALCALLLHKAKVNEGMASSDATCADRSATQPISLTASVLDEMQAGADPESEYRDMVLAWPAKTLQEIVCMFGERAKSNLILGTIIRFIVKHCRHDNGEFLEGLHDLENLWGACVEALAGSAASSTSIDNSSLHAEDPVAPAPTPMAEGAYDNYLDYDEDPARRSTCRQGSLAPRMPFVVPTSPLQAHATLPDSTSIVQPSGLLGYIHRHQSSVGGEEALNINRHMAPLSNSQPVESHSPSGHQYRGKTPGSRFRTSYSPPLLLPRLLPHNATVSHSQGQTSTARRFELRSPSASSQRPFQSLASQPSDARSHLPGPLNASQNGRAYDEADGTQLAWQKTYLSKYRPSTAIADPRPLPSPRSNGLVGEIWKDSSSYGSTFTANSAAHSKYPPLPTFTVPLVPRQVIYRPQRAESTSFDSTGASGIVTQLVGPVICTQPGAVRRSAVSDTVPWDTHHCPVAHSCKVGFREPSHRRSSMMPIERPWWIVVGRMRRHGS